jgi:hypothetical protein
LVTGFLAQVTGPPGKDIGFWSQYSYARTPDKQTRSWDTQVKTQDSQAKSQNCRLEEREEIDGEDVNPPFQLAIQYRSSIHTKTLRLSFS